MQRSQSDLSTGQESPAPIRIVPDSRQVVVQFGGETIAESHRAVRVLESGHPPVFYLPPEDVRTELLVANGRQTLCEHKGDAHYYDLTVDGRTAENAAWCYPEPLPGVEAIQYAIAFYSGRVDACTIDGHRVTPEDNPDFGGWIIEE